MKLIIKRMLSLLLCTSLVIALIPYTTSKASSEDNNFEGRVSTGYDVCAIIKDDDSLWTWGDEFYDTLGDDSTSARWSPVQILEDVKYVAYGYKHAGAIKNDGSLWMWGRNDSGALGTGSLNSSTVPKKIMTNVSKIALGDGSVSAALKTDGSLWMWGANNYGQLGYIDSSANYKMSPVKVMDDVVDMDVGATHSAAVKSDGSLWMWGANNYGQLGTTATVTPGYLVKLMDNVKQVELGYHHTLVLKTDGSLWTFGYNGSGQLGNGTCNTNVNATPTKIMDDVKQISAGQHFSTALKTNGYLYSWGANNNGQLGTGSTTGRYSPELVTSDVTYIYSKANNNIAVKSDHGVYIWGHYSGYVSTNITEPKFVSKATFKVEAAPEEPETPETPTTIDLSNCTIQNLESEYVHTGSPVCPEVSLIYESETLTEGTDYSVYYSDNTNIGTATLILTGQGKYSGISIHTFEIKPSTYTVKYNANGGTKAPASQTKEYGKSLTLRTAKPTKSGYIFQGWATSKSATKITYASGATYNDNKNITLYAVWKKKAAQKITASDKSIVKGNSSSLNAKTNGGGKLTYKSSNTKVATVSSAGKVTAKSYGKATITITAKETSTHQTATKKVTIKVIPKKVTWNYAKSTAKKQLKLSWKKDSTITGYQCQISQRSTFNYKTIQRYYTKGTSMPQKLSGLTSKKTYYIRIRSYKTVSGVKYYSNWSTTKKVTIK